MMKMIVLVLAAMVQWSSTALKLSQDPSANNTLGNGDDAEELLYPEGFFFDDAYSRSLGHAKNVHPGITYNHMPKAGGNFIKDIINQVVDKNEIRIEGEFDSLLPGDATRFTIGGIRNPCDYYVSLYSYGVAGNGEFRKRCPSELYKQDSPEHFQKWLKYIMADKSGTTLGVLSHRFAVSYGRANIRSVRGPIRDLSFDEAHQVKDVMRKFNRSAVDCWVKTENITSDLKQCLIKYEKTGGSVKWTEFDDMVKHAYHNPSKHMACSMFFSNDSSRSLVKEADGELFDIFDYSCCREN